MNKRYSIIISCIITAVLVYFLMLIITDDSDIDIIAETGATPVALAQRIPSEIFLSVDGLVKHEYSFSGKTLNAFATTRIRTQELSVDGKLIGTYSYIGIPVIHILEGIVPKKTENAVFDRPLDLIVTFISSNGNSAHYSYGEIVFADDALPVTLAFFREEIRASKNPKTYEKNIFKEGLKGLRVISPRDSDTGRYLDNVIKITLREPKVDYNILPKQQKGIKCVSSAITCLWNNTIRAGKFNNVNRQRKDNWFRTGHGRGFKGISNAEGYNLRSFLRRNFPECSSKNYFLFVACDGYRSLFSGREIFDTVQGAAMMILGTIDSKRANGGFMLAPVEDYFVDRNVWGLSYIIALDNI